MTIRHIIVEGPDGSGKTGLIKRLMEVMGRDGYRVHARASNSIGGPIPTLRDWTELDLKSLHNPEYSWIYDRHPVFSEPIYAPIARKVKPQEPFGDELWLDTVRVKLAETCMVIWCQPPLATVLENMTSDVDQMPGVRDSISQIYREYTDSMWQWPGFETTWDYTIDKNTGTGAAFDRLLAQINVVRGLTWPRDMGMFDNG